MPAPLHILHVEDSPQDGELICVTLAREWPDCRIERVETREDLRAELQREPFDFMSGGVGPDSGFHPCPSVVLTAFS